MSFGTLRERNALLLHYRQNAGADPEAIKGHFADHLVGIGKAVMVEEDTANCASDISCNDEVAAKYELHLFKSSTGGVVRY